MEHIQTITSASGSANIGSRVDETSSSILVVAVTDGSWDATTSTLVVQESNDGVTWVSALNEVGSANTVTLGALGTTYTLNIPYVYGKHTRLSLTVAGGVLGGVAINASSKIAR